MYTALQAVQMMPYTTLEDRQENFPCGLGSGTIPAQCLVNGQVLHLASSQGKVPAVSRLFLCFGRVLTTPSGSKVGDKRQGPLKNSPQPGVRLQDREGSVNQLAQWRQLVTSRADKGHPVCIGVPPASL